MKTLRLIVLSALAGWIGLSTQAQTLIFNGSVSLLNGRYASEFSVGDPIALSLSFLSPPEDLNHGSDLNRGIYRANVSFTVNGSSALLGPDPLGAAVTIENDYEYQSLDGILFGVAWNGPTNPGTLLFNLSTSADVLDSITSFPSGIPIDVFSTKGGYYQNDSAAFYGGPGRIEWNITSYTGSFEGIITPPPPPINPVPEPATYGLFAAAGLTVLVAYRRRSQGLRPANAGVFSSKAA